jgi:hypothetical protein
MMKQIDCLIFFMQTIESRINMFNFLNPKCCFCKQVKDEELKKIKMLDYFNETHFFKNYHESCLEYHLHNKFDFDKTTLAVNIAENALAEKKEREEYIKKTIERADELLANRIAERKSDTEKKSNKI